MPADDGYHDEDTDEDEKTKKEQGHESSAARRGARRFSPPGKGAVDRNAICGSRGPSLQSALNVGQASQDASIEVVPAELGVDGVLQRLLLGWPENFGRLVADLDVCLVVRLVNEDEDAIDRPTTQIGLHALFQRPGERWNRDHHDLFFDGLQHLLTALGDGIHCRSRKGWASWLNVTGGPRRLGPECCHEAQDDQPDALVWTHDGGSLLCAARSLAALFATGRAGAGLCCCHVEPARGPGRSRTKVVPCIPALNPRTTFPLRPLLPARRYRGRPHWQGQEIREQDRSPGEMAHSPGDDFRGWTRKRGPPGLSLGMDTEVTT